MPTHLAEERARIGWREGVFQIGFRGQLGEFVGRELTAQKSPELFAEPQPGCSRARCRAPRAADRSTRGCREFPNRATLSTSLPRRFALNCGDLPHQIAPLIPGLQLGARAACFHHEIFRCNREPFLTRLAQHGILAGFEEALDGSKDFSPP